MSAGVYVHIPFCLRRCDYCDFTTFVDRDEAIPAYVKALTTHVRRSREVDAAEPAEAGPEVGDTTFSSLFIGGGTPTYLAPDQLGQIIRAVRDTLPLDADAECTVEANPETVTADMAGELADRGITRVSLGAQSFDARVLSTLGRWHDVGSVGTAVSRLRGAGIQRLSLDLIYGTPGETEASWRRSLHQTLDLGVTHVSAYALTVEPNTPYASRVRQRPDLAPDEDVQAARMAVAEEVLAAAGFRRYEVSNWAVPGHESTHNLTYWRGGEWLAFGSGAHGAWRGRRYWLVRDPGAYARMVGEGVEPRGGQERPDADQVRLERLMMGLRLVEGVPRVDVEPLDRGALALLEDRGLLDVSQDRITLTGAGMPLADRVVRLLA